LRLSVCIILFILIVFFATHVNISRWCAAFKTQTSMKVLSCRLFEHLDIVSAVINCTLWVWPALSMFESGALMLWRPYFYHFVTHSYIGLGLLKFHFMSTLKICIWQYCQWLFCCSLCK